MSIEKTLFEEESKKLTSYIKEGLKLSKEKKYPEAVEAYSNAIISAGLILQKDEKLGLDLRYDRLIKALLGYQMEVYVEMAEECVSSEEDYDYEKVEEIKEKINKIAQGPLNERNKNQIDIIKAIDECEDFFQ